MDKAPFLEVMNELTHETFLDAGNDKNKSGFSPIRTGDLRRVKATT